MKVNLSNAVTFPLRRFSFKPLELPLIPHLGYGSSAVSFGKLMLVLIYTVLFSGPIYLLTRLIATHLNPVLRA